MESSGNLSASPRFLTPATLVEQLPSRPVLTSRVVEQSGLVLQRFQHPPSTIDVVGLRDVLLVDHLAGPVLVTEDRQSGIQERRWTGPGQISLTPAGEPLHRTLKGRPDVALLHLAPGLMGAVAEEVFGLDATRIGLLPRFAVPDTTADRLVRLLLDEAERPGSGTLLMMQSLTRALAVHLLRCHSNLAPSPPNPLPSLPPSRIKRVIERMRSNLGEDLSLDRLAKSSGLSPSQFARAFRRATGLPAHRYLIGLRIEKARELLEQTDMPIIEVGLRCGFEQASHFATSFRATTGFTPREWRQARRS